MESNFEPERARVSQRVAVRARMGVTESQREPEKDKERASKGQREPQREPVRARGNQSELETTRKSQSEPE